MKVAFTILVCFGIILSSCYKKEVVNDADHNLANGKQEQMNVRTINFSGYQWQVRSTGNARQGPGGNYFSSNSLNVFIDANGDLQLNIQKALGKWGCSEVYTTNTTGYGKYIYVTKGNLENYDEKIVPGLFTWDNYSFQTDANSELDLEFSKWGDANKNITTLYSVQPTRGGVYSERNYTPASNIIYDANGYSTHIINWQPDKVIFETHTGDDTTAATLLFRFVFDDTNPPRTAKEGNATSNSVVIPHPQSDTRPHINFWLFDENGDGKGDAPANKQNAALVIHRFQYIPD